jgi:hypothetical protein
VALLRGATDKEPKRERFVFTDAETGRAVTEIKRSANVAVASCGDDGATLIACVTKDTKTYDKKVTIFRVDRRTATTVVLNYSEGVEVNSGWSGRVQLSGVPYGHAQDDGRVFTMDSAGNVIDRNLEIPGDVVDVSDDLATIVNADDGVVEEYPVLK